MPRRGIAPRLLMTACLFASVADLRAAHAQAGVLETLRPSHPRLFEFDDDLPALRKWIQSDEVAKYNYREIRANADAMLSLPVEQYVIRGGTLLGVAQNVENRVLTLAGLYRITGEQRYAMRAKQEMLAAASFSDWNPKHFLEAAEMTAALGIGYDWLYPVLSLSERQTIRGAIVTKGIRPWLDNIRGPGNLGRMGNNWVQVCTGGITVGALAVAEDEPALAREVIEDSRPIMTTIMKLFAPDGGFEEGPIYWDYAVTYNVLYLASLDSALGTDFGLSEMPGFSQTGDYRAESLSPTERAANFGDAHERAPRSYEMYWLAKRFHHSEYELQEIRFSAAQDKMPDARRYWQEARFGIFSLFWYTPITYPAAVKSPLVESFSRINQVFLRTSWVGTDPWYVAFKGGSNRAHHAHLDLGSFILDASAERWAMDLGGEDYGVPGYFDSKAQRWKYFRTRTESHNTLTVDDQNQDLDGTATLTMVRRTADKEFAEMDLGQAYKGKLTSWSRGVALLGGNRMLVQDEFVPRASARVVWHLMTDAKIKIASLGNEAILSQGKKSLRVRILAPAGARFDTKGTQPPRPESRNPGVTDLEIQLQDVKTAETITVLFSATDDASALPGPAPLSTWDKP